jgi:hypothetical protein
MKWIKIFETELYLLFIILVIGGIYLSLYIG